ncbi:olfactory receptor 5AP2-like [Marmota monax]|uniref:olfactory receptor 5AP2-like n=1 Tax=Marmota monax TaxID=9995 RepID=UPI001EB01434|nr:olfactory receptor 5AP2-like [Marmota monax]
MANCTQVSEFVLLGFRGGPGMQKALFLVFLVLYVVTMVGNLGMIAIIRADAHLHTPMYDFLQSLSLLDVCYSSTIVPRALVNCLKDDRRVSFAGCASQFFFLSLFGTTEAFLLAAMAYDRFSAICNPLLYPMSMTRRVCGLLVSGSYAWGLVNAVTQTTMTFRLSFCGPNEINDFFCDVPPLLSLSCSDTSVNQWVLLGLCGFIIVGTFLVVLVSYFCIISAILKIRTVQGRHRAFSTCASHLTGVCLFFGTVFFMYAQPSAVSSLEQSKVVSIFYTVVIPMLNPLIYSLRNKDVKQALKRAKRKLSGVLGLWISQSSLESAPNHRGSWVGT